MNKVKRLLVLIPAVLSISLLSQINQTANAGTYTFVDCATQGTIPSSVWSGPNNLWTGEAEQWANVSSTAFQWHVPCSSSFMSVSSKLRTYNKDNKASLRYSLPGNLRFTKLLSANISQIAGSGYESGVRFGEKLGSNQQVLSAITSYSDTRLLGPIDTTGTTFDVFDAYVKCNLTTCPSYYATSAISDVALTISDPTPPVTAMAGTLFNSGSPVSGTKTVIPIGIDTDSGVRSVHVYVNGANYISLYNLTCATDGSKLVPCTTPFMPNVTVDTTKAPFVNGANTVVTCVNDYAEPPSYPNIACTPPYGISVSN